MQKALFLVYFFFATIAAHAQISYEDFKSLIPGMETENWKEVFIRSQALLETNKKDSSGFTPIVRYMHLMAGAGMVSEKQMTPKRFRKIAERYIGKQLSMAIHPCIDSGKLAYNSLEFITGTDGIHEGLTIEVNKTHSSILFFEYFRFDKFPDPAAYIGKNVRCGGILESVEVSPGFIWVARLRLAHSTVVITEPR